MTHWNHINAVLAFAFLISSCLLATANVPSRSDDDLLNKTDQDAARFVADYERTVRPIEIEVARAWWNANTTGRDEDFAAKENAENRLNATLADPEKFATLKAIRASNLHDPVLSRQMEILYLKYLEKQLNPDLLQRMTAKANAIEKSFNVFRADVNGTTYSDSEVRRVMTTSTNSDEVQAVWLASKRVGSAVEKNILELVLLRNDAANRLGFVNYHQMKLFLQEQDPVEITRLFDELDRMTREPFAQVKQEIDDKLAQRFGVAVDQLRPWHYQDPFFQEAPTLDAANFDSVFRNTDIPAVCGKFYAGIGLPIDDVLARSDLYEKPGKSPHAFCIDIDRQGDVRVLCNIVPNEYWMGTTLHELGHSVYSSKNIPNSLPWLVRCESHVLTTEGIAMMFERFASSGKWMQDMGIELEDPAAFSEISHRKRQQKLLIFSRWCQVMFRFEQSMYENPQQDLNKLWWDLVEKYQMVHRPDDRNAPDYGSKVHIVSAPVYYHNYMMGELFACQLHERIATGVLNNDNPSDCVYTNNKAVGQFLCDKVFSQGALRSWNDLTEFATGSQLNARAFAAEFSNKN